MIDRELGGMYAFAGGLFGLLMGLLFGGILSAAGFDNHLSRMVKDCDRSGSEIVITRTAGELVFDCKKPDEGQ